MIVSKYNGLSSGNFLGEAIERWIDEDYRLSGYVKDRAVVKAMGYRRKGIRKGLYQIVQDEVQVEYYASR